MTHSLVWSIIAVSFVTCLIRVVPVLFLAHRNFPVILRNWLVYIPTAIIAAIIASEVIQREETTSFGVSVGLLATIVCFIVAALSRSLFLSVVVSIVAYLVFQNL